MPQSALDLPAQRRANLLLAGQYAAMPMAEAQSRVVQLAADAAIVQAARAQGQFFDPTYTAKAFAGLRTIVVSGNFHGRGPIIFIHTGGEPTLFADMRKGLLA